MPESAPVDECCCVARWKSDLEAAPALLAECV